LRRVLELFTVGVPESSSRAAEAPPGAGP
jgi:hypothetical protein